MKRVLLVLSMVLLASCSKESSGGGSNDNFNREVVLDNWVNNIILPAYANFDTKLATLAAAEQSFVTTANEDNLLTLQNALFDAQKAWQHVAMFEFGKAEELSYRMFMNSYPIDLETSVSKNDTNEDETNIADNLIGKFKVRVNDPGTGAFLRYDENDLSIANIDFTLSSRADEQGFPVVDYLVNGVGTNNAEIVAFYESDSNAANHKEYLTKVVDRMQGLTAQVIAYWNTNSSAIIANSGSSATASFDKLANDYLNYFEQGFREAKIATPSGKRDGNKRPNTVESFYSSQNSKALFLEAYTAVKNLYYGKAFGDVSKDGESFPEYLDALNATAYDVNNKVTKNLTSFIEEQFAAIDVEVAKLDADFVNQVNSNHLLMTDTFNEIQKTVVLVKADGFSAMNIIVDFVDGDGD